MASSDERKAVAEKLKEYPLESVKAEHKCKDPLQLPADVMYDLMDIAGVGEDFDSLLPALADLIDPTCHMRPAHAGGFGCDRCFTWFPDMKAKTSYCPHCGARVVSD
jgi:hypothetical protein